MTTEIYQWATLVLLGLIFVSLAILVAKTIMLIEEVMGLGQRINGLHSLNNGNLAQCVHLCGQVEDIKNVLKERMGAAI